MNVQLQWPLLLCCPTNTCFLQPSWPEWDLKINQEINFVKSEMISADWLKHRLPSVPDFVYFPNQAQLWPPRWDTSSLGTAGIMSTLIFTTQPTLAQPPTLLKPYGSTMGLPRVRPITWVLSHLGSDHNLTSSRGFGHAPLPHNLLVSHKRWCCPAGIVRPHILGRLYRQLPRLGIKATRASGIGTRL